MFPELCKTISEKFKHYRQSSGMRRTELVCKEVRRISKELHDQGIEPTRRRISLHMEHSAYFFRSQGQDELKAIRQELRYENTQAAKENEVWDNSE